MKAHVWRYLKWKNKIKQANKRRIRVAPFGTVITLKESRPYLVFNREAQNNLKMKNNETKILTKDRQILTKYRQILTKYKQILTYRKRIIELTKKKTNKWIKYTKTTEWNIKSRIEWPPHIDILEFGREIQRNDWLVEPNRLTIKKIVINTKCKPEIYFTLKKVYEIELEEMDERILARINDKIRIVKGKQENANEILVNREEEMLETEILSKIR